MRDGESPVVAYAGPLTGDDPQFLIESGVMKQDSDEFVRFKRQNITKWGTISQLITQLERFLSKYIVKFAYISSAALLNFAEMEQDRYTEDDLISTISNQAQVLAVVKNPQKMFKGPGGPIMAAIMI